MSSLTKPVPTPAAQKELPPDQEWIEHVHNEREHESLFNHSSNQQVAAKGTMWRKKTTKVVTDHPNSPMVGSRPATATTPTDPDATPEPHAPSASQPETPRQSPSISWRKTTQPVITNQTVTTPTTDPLASQADLARTIPPKEAAPPVPMGPVASTESNHNHETVVWSQANDGTMEFNSGEFHSIQTWPGVSTPKKPKLGTALSDTDAKRSPSLASEVESRPVQEPSSPENKLSSALTGESASSRLPEQEPSSSQIKNTDATTASPVSLKEPPTTSPHETDPRTTPVSLSPDLTPSPSSWRKTAPAKVTVETSSEPPPVTTDLPKVTVATSSEPPPVTTDLPKVTVETSSEPPPVTTDLPKVTVATAPEGSPVKTDLPKVTVETSSERPPVKADLPKVTVAASTRERPPVKVQTARSDGVGPSVKETLSAIPPKTVAPKPTIVSQPIKTTTPPSPVRTSIAQSTPILKRDPAPTPDKPMTQPELPHEPPEPDLFALDLHSATQTIHTPERFSKDEHARFDALDRIASTSPWVRQRWLWIVALVMVLGAGQVMGLADWLAHRFKPVRLVEQAPSHSTSIEAITAENATVSPTTAAVTTSSAPEVKMTPTSIPPEVKSAGDEQTDKKSPVPGGTKKEWLVTKIIKPDQDSSSQEQRIAMPLLLEHPTENTLKEIPTSSAPVVKMTPTSSAPVVKPADNQTEEKSSEPEKTNKEWLAVQIIQPGHEGKSPQQRVVLPLLLGETPKNNSAKPLPKARQPEKLEPGSVAVPQDRIKTHQTQTNQDSTKKRPKRVAAQTSDTMPPEVNQSATIKTAKTAKPRPHMPALGPEKIAKRRSQGNRAAHKTQADPMPIEQVVAPQPTTSKPTEEKINFVVSYGCFSNIKEIAKREKQIQSRGWPVLTSHYNIDQTTMTCLFGGPFVNPREADQATGLFEEKGCMQIPKEPLQAP
ncbi:MAG: hypothetical protein H7839_13265 [Magnetococcus sp. YQC-5]